MSEVFECHEIKSGPGTGEPHVRLTLRRHTADLRERNRKLPRKPVLLLHGASAGHQTFTFPNAHEGHHRCLADWLSKEGYEPWLLDWRGSFNVVDDADNRGTLTNDGHIYNFNAAAEHDIPSALDVILEERKQQAPIGAVGFCMGAGVLAEAVARRALKPSEVDRVVLMTLGLFYETPVDARLKGEDRVLERLMDTEDPTGRPIIAVDPRVDPSEMDDKSRRQSWPDDLNRLYRMWPDRLKAHSQKQIRKASLASKECGAALEMCNRIGFMYGMPFHERNLVSEVHGDEPFGAGSGPELPRQFGAIPLHMFIHGAQNVRRGWAGVYKFADRNGAAKASSAGHPPVDSDSADHSLVNSEARGHFEILDRVTLITGAMNRLWHRDSIDLMYEWLRRAPPSRWNRFRKVIIPNFGHQDLLWGRDAPKTVFPAIKSGLQDDKSKN